MSHTVTTIGGIVVICIFLFELWHAIHTRNWGKFDKTSMIVWGAVLLLILVSVGFVIYITQAK